MLKLDMKGSYELTIQKIDKVITRTSPGNIRYIAANLRGQDERVLVP
jgi:hypothetical protein